MSRILKLIAPLSLFLTATFLYAAGPMIQSARYVPDENKLVLTFDEDVDAGSVLLGQLSFDDDNGGPNADLSLRGGSVLTPAGLSSTLEINLLYSTVIDSFVGAYYGDNTYVFRLWGAKPDQLMTLENMDADNLVLTAGAGAFIDNTYESSAMQSVACTVDAVTAQPEIVSATYDANINKMQFVFSDVVQFDQIAEDRSVAGGPGNGLLQSPVGTNDPGEDRNGNGVLDFEQNIKFLRIGFSGTGGSMTLENIGSVVQTADNDTIDMYVTNNDAKRLEGTIGLDANLKLDIQPWAFVDQNYNPNAYSDMGVTAIVDTVDFVPDSASYNLSKNELSIFFNNLADAGRSIKITRPAPVYTKIVLSNGTESHTISGVEGNPSTIGATGFKFKLQIIDQASVEALINGSSLSLAMESYAIYDNLGNGNADITGIPVEVVETASANEQPPTLEAASFDEDTQTLQLTWSLSLGVGYYLGNTLPAMPADWDDLASQELTGFGAYDPIADSTITFGSGKVYYSGSKKNTYVRLDQADAIRIQSYPNLSDLHVIADRDVFNAFLFLNGNSEATAEDSVFLSIVPDTTAPVITNAKMNVFTQSMEFDVDEPIQAAAIDPADFKLGNVTLGGTVSAITGAAYDNQFILNLDETSYNAFMALPDSILVAPDLISASSALTNLAGIGSAAATMNAPAGRYFYLLSREAFVTPTATRFGALKLISDHCEIYVDEDVWGTRITMDDVLKLAETFETKTPMDSTQGIKAIVDEWYGDVKDTDGNGKVIIFLADVLDEYDLGRNDTNSSFFENGYITMADTTDSEFSNRGDIIYLDVDPQVIGTPPYTTWNHSMLHALAYQYTHMAALHNKPAQEPWIRYGVALKLQEMVVGNVKFFGDGANTKATAANELTYINASLLKSRDDLFNVYNFFTYLTEKYSDPDDPLAVIRAIAASDELGVAAVDEAIAQFDESTTTAEAFSNYGTACFLDMVQDSTGAADDVDSLYNGIYSFDALLLNAPPSGKNAGNIPWDKAANNGAPFPKSGIFPWSFNFYVSRAYFLNLEGQVIIVSPDLQPEDT
ncbi:MAG: hypothetical protein K9N36_09040, partial [Candidatus Marinimicrobia bacterium]|nr:hypothetical protein [Candidatus Neomarinimicrobiota bacterium]